MKIAVWAICFLLLGFWTGGTLLMTALTGWAARQFASGEAAATGAAVGQWPVPPWISVWFDVAWIQAAQGSLTWALTAFDSALPFVGSAVGWIVPLMWVLWGLGALLLLMLAGGAHLMIGRLQPKQPRQLRGA